MRKTFWDVIGSRYALPFYVAGDGLWADILSDNKVPYLFNIIPASGLENVALYVTAAIAVTGVTILTIVSGADLLNALRDPDSRFSHMVQAMKSKLHRPTIDDAAD